MTLTFDGLWRWRGLCDLNEWGIDFVDYYPSYLTIQESASSDWMDWTQPDSADESVEPKVRLRPYAAKSDWSRDSAVRYLRSNTLPIFCYLIIARNSSSSWSTAIGVSTIMLLAGSFSIVGYWTRFAESCFYCLSISYRRRPTADGIREDACRSWRFGLRLDGTCGLIAYSAISAAISSSCTLPDSCGTSHHSQSTDPFSVGCWIVRGRRGSGTHPSSSQYSDLFTSAVEPMTTSSTIISVRHSHYYPAAPKTISD